MKTTRCCALLIIAVLSVAQVHAQSDWYWQNPSPQGNNLLDVEMVSDSVAVVVGWAGSILRTVDAGLSWTGDFRGDNILLMDAAFSGEAVGLAVGLDFQTISAPVVLRSADGGVTWSTIPFAELYPRAVAFSGSGAAVIGTSRGTLYRSTDGGVHWDSAMGNSGTEIKCIAFGPAGTGLAVGNAGVVYKTTDDGLSWSPRSGGTDNSLHGVTFVSDSIAVAVGSSGTMLRSTDVGETWNGMPAMTTLYCLAVAAIDGNRVVVVGGNDDIGGRQGVLLCSSNQGSAWIDLSAQITRGLVGVAFRPSGIGIAVGTDGAMYRSTDAGAHWDSLMRGATGELLAIHFADKHYGWAVGSAIGGGNIILRTSDGGSSWHSTPSGVSVSLRGVYFIDRSTGWAVGWCYPDSTAVLKTTDGGNTWEPSSSGVSVSLGDVFFVDHATGWAVGYRGTIVKSTDGGGSWLPQSSGTISDLTSVHFVSGSTGWVTGWNGLILKTTDGGSSWNPQQQHTLRTLQSVVFHDINNGWVVGDSSIIMRTTDSGMSWFLQTVGPSGDYLRAVSFGDAQHGWAVGEGGHIFATEDGGLTWSRQQSRTMSDMFGVFFLDDSTGWAVGKGGTIVATVPGGPPTSIAEEGVEETPECIRLLPNYPNPFNPSTTICYALDQPGAVTLAVYNLLGQRVAVLVDERKTVGLHRVVFRNPGLAGGVYIYRLTAGPQSASRKFVLVK